jgi:aspartyl-tRNA(Asn)/glutamyl-tRNA(Gln) amidotransferase subunit B
MKWETVIGLEVHVQLATKSKLFSCASTAYGAKPNTQTSFIDAALPGVLPVVNQKAVEYALRFGLAIEAEINNHSFFERKNYFYPDLPKGYQISQFQRPIVGRGKLSIATTDGPSKEIGITRAHLEEDAGKSLHEDFHGFSGIDLNRAGTPLLEVVSEPDMRNANEAVSYLKTLHQLVKTLGICDGNMQEGSFRVDVNLSIRTFGSDVLGTRTELKNLNSFKFIEKAIEYETARHIDLIESGEKVIQQTRLYDPNRNRTYAMRSKEEANDYRYFPDPDLLPIEITESLFAKVKQELPELPKQKLERMSEEYNLDSDEIKMLIQEPSLCDYFENMSAHHPELEHKLILNWLRGEVLAYLNKLNISIENFPLNEASLAKLLLRISDDTISSKIAKSVFEKMCETKQDVDEIIEQQGLKQMDNSQLLEEIIQKLIAENPNQVDQYRQGKTKVLGFFVGQVMKQTQGKANPKQVNEILLKHLT